MEKKLLQVFTPAGLISYETGKGGVISITESFADKWATVKKREKENEPVTEITYINLPFIVVINPVQSVLSVNRM
jgi:hypothetical protein